MMFFHIISDGVLTLHVIIIDRARFQSVFFILQHTFIVHVDLKSPESQEIFEEYAKDKDNVFVMDRYRQGLNWGGFTIVNATLGEIIILYHYSWFA